MASILRQKRSPPSAGRLVVVEEGSELREEDRHRADLPEQPHRAVRRTTTHEPQDLLEDARACGLRELLATRHHRVVDVRLDAEVEPRRELDRAEDANRVLAEADDRLADGVNRAAFDVLHPAAPVEHLAAIEVVEERVDGEVATNRVLVGVAEDVVAANEEVVRPFAVLGLDLDLRAATEGRDLDRLRAEHDVGETEAPPDDAAVAEERPHVLGTRAGRDVVVLRRPAEEEVPDASSDEVGLEPSPLEPANDLGRVRVEAIFVEGDGVANRARCRRGARPRGRLRARPGADSTRRTRELGRAGR